MAGILEELRNENKKSGLFISSDVGISYPTGMPILDQNLGNRYTLILPSGEKIVQTNVGVPAGRHTMLVGPSASGKSTAAIQMSWNVCRRFDEDSVVHYIDGEQTMTWKRIKDISCASNEELENKWHLEHEHTTWEDILALIVKIHDKKKSDKDRYMYDTKQYDIFGNRIYYYKPTFIIVDSLMKIVSKGVDQSELQGLTAGGRDAIENKRWYRNTTDYMAATNINVIMINHLGNTINLQPGQGGSKQLTFIPTGKNIPGGEGPVYYSSSIVIFQPMNSKEFIKNEFEHGYNGYPVKALVCKSKTNRNGTVAEMIFSQDTGFNPVLTLAEFARGKDLIKGRNPKCYFESNPELTFDTRGVDFVKMIQSDPDITRELYRVCKPALSDLIPDSSYQEEVDFMRSIKVRNQMYDLLDMEMGY